MVKKKLNRRFFVSILGVVCILGIYNSKSNADMNRSDYDRKEIYVVKDGDSISTIAARYKKNYENINNVEARIMYANNMNGDVIYPGEKVIVPIQ